MPGLLTRAERQLRLGDQLYDHARFRQGPDPNRAISVFSYCPPPYGWPFEVALGFDPMWENLGTESDAFVETVARQKWTLYTSIIGRQYYPSYGAPNELQGYISIDFNGRIDRPWAKLYWRHKAGYLCADKHANSMLP
jgi:hypothetical protein